MGSRARPYHSHRGGGTLTAPPVLSPRGAPRAPLPPPPFSVVPPPQPSWRGDGGGRAGRAAGGGAERAAPPAGGSGARRVTYAALTRREGIKGSGRGSPAPEAAPAEERQTRSGRRRPPSRSSPLASPLPAPIRGAARARSPPSHDVPRLHRRLRGALLPLQQRFPGRGQPHLLPVPGGLLLQHGLPRQPAGEGLAASRGGDAGGGGGRRGPSKAPGSPEARCRRLPVVCSPAGGVPVPVGRGVRGYGGSRGRAARGGGCVKRLH